MEVFNIILTCCCNMITVAMNIFKSEESLSYVEKETLNEDSSIISEDGNSSTRAYNMTIITYDCSYIFSYLLDCVKLLHHSKY
jgi:hypothetical protein